MAVSQAVVKNGRDTKEYQVLQKKFTSVVNLVQHNLQPFANSLFSKYLIQNLSTGSSNKYNEASSLLKMVVAKVEADANNCSKFTDALQDIGMTECADCIRSSIDAPSISVSQLNESGPSLIHLNSVGTDSDAMDSGFSTNDTHFVFDLNDATSQNSSFDQENKPSTSNDSISLDSKSEVYQKLMSYRDIIKLKEIKIENQKKEIDSLKNLQKAIASELEQLKKDLSKASEEIHLVLEGKKEAEEAMKAHQVNCENLKNEIVEMEGRVLELERNAIMDEKKFKEKEENLRKQIEEGQEKEEKMSLDLKRIQVQLFRAEIQHLKEQQDWMKKIHELEKIKLQLQREVEKQEQIHKLENRAILAEKNVELEKKNTELEKKNTELEKKNTEMAVKKAKLVEDEKDLVFTKQQCAETELQAIKKELKKVLKEKP